MTNMAVTTELGSVSAADRARVRKLQEFVDSPEYAQMLEAITHMHFDLPFLRTRESSACRANDAFFDVLGSINPLLAGSAVDFHFFYRTHHSATGSLVCRPPRRSRACRRRCADFATHFERSSTSAAIFANSSTPAIVTVLPRARLSPSILRSRVVRLPQVDVSIICGLGECLTGPCSPQRTFQLQGAYIVCTTLFSDHAPSHPHSDDGAVRVSAGRDLVPADQGNIRSSVG